MKTKVESNIKHLIKDIGKKVDDFKAPKSPLEEYMVDLGMQIVSQLKQSLREAGDQNSILSQSIVSKVTSSSENVDLVITANDYWDFVNSGVNGVKKNVGGKYNFKTPYPSKKMTESIQVWQSNRGIGHAKNFKSVSYAIATKVKRDGIEPNYFVDKVLSDEFIKNIENELAKEFKKSLTLTIK